MLLFTFLGSLSFLSGCAMENQKINSSLEHMNEVKGGEVYTNQEYGFTLTFPDSWQGFTVEKRTLNWGEFGFGDSFDFGFGSNLSEKGLFNISIHTKEQWKQIQNEEGPKPTYVGESDKRIFASSNAQDVSSDFHHERFLEVSKILKTFQLTSNLNSGKVSGFVSDVSFEYPAQFTYSGGGDIDTGSFSWINGVDANGKEFTFVRIFDSALMKCKFEDPALCEIDAWVPASADDVYVSFVKNYKKDQSFTYDGQVKTVNTIGEKFIKNSRLEENDDIKAVVVIKSKSGVFLFQQINSNASEFEEFISSIKVNE